MEINMCVQFALFNQKPKISFFYIPCILPKIWNNIWLLLGSPKDFGETSVFDVYYEGVIEEYTLSLCINISKSHYKIKSFSPAQRALVLVSLATESGFSPCGVTWGDLHFWAPEPWFRLSMNQQQSGASHASLFSRVNSHEVLPTSQKKIDLETKDWDSNSNLGSDQMWELEQVTWPLCALVSLPANGSCKNFVGSKWMKYVPGISKCSMNSDLDILYAGLLRFTTALFPVMEMNPLGYIP